MNQLQPIKSPLGCAILLCVGLAIPVSVVTASLAVAKGEARPTASPATHAAGPASARVIQSNDRPVG